MSPPTEVTASGSRRRRTGAALMSVVMACSLSLAPLVFADAYDAAMTRGVAAKEKAIDGNSVAAWADALRLFEEADAVRSTSDSKYEIAGAAVHVKEDDVALQAYEAAIELGVSGKPKEKAQAFIAANGATMGRVDVKGPAGAEVFVGTRRRAVLPMSKGLVVFPGTVKVRVVLGDDKVEESVTVGKGESRPLDVTAKLAAASNSTVGTIPSASVSTNPSVVASSTATSTSTAVVPGAGATDDGSGARSLGWVLIASGGVVLGAGVVGVLVGGSSVRSGRESLVRDCKTLSGQDDCPTPLNKDAAQNDVDKIATGHNVQTVGFIAIGVGAVAAILGVVRLVTAPSSGPSASTSSTSAGSSSIHNWTPQLAVGNGGLFLGLGGAF